jgi:hypothetical protein
MSDTSHRLELPFIQPSQAQKHVTHNEALQRLDALVQLSVVQLEADTPPATATEGEIHGLGADPSGAWAGHAGMLAIRGGTAWQFLAPQEGWRAWDENSGDLHVFTDGAWQRALPALEDLPGLGIGTSSDAANKLAVAAPASLFTHAGDSHRMKINKSAEAETASLLFQSGWTGHAEVGLAGETALTVKTSADGNSWYTALRLDPAAQEISFAPGGTVRARLTDAALELNAPVTGGAVQAEATDATAGRLMAVGAFGWGTEAAQVPGDDIDDIATAGSYRLSATVIGNSPGLAPLSPAEGSPLLQLQSDGANAAQLLVAQPSGAGHIRTRSSGTWQEWRGLYDTHNVVGVVSQSGGQPAGAVIERGENANGEYIRLADGTQIATNANSPITTAPAAFAGAITKIDNDKLWLGRWF